MSSMRNAVQRRVHRERAQPKGREKWGLLEKHKDYSLRARDYNLKKAQLQRLRQKARDKNPDEFAFGMMSEKSRTTGKHGTREGKALSHATVQLLKTQDAGYLKVVGERIRRQLDKTEQEVQLQKGLKDALSGSGGGKKVVFVDSVEEQEERVMAAEDGGTEEEDDKCSVTEKPKSKKQLEAQKKARKELKTAQQQKRRSTLSRQKRLEILKKQNEDIIAAEQELDLQRGKMAKAVGGVNKNGIKWKIRERKK